MVTLDGTGTFAMVLPEGPVIDVTLVEDLDDDGVATEVTEYRLVEGASACLGRTSAGRGGRTLTGRSPRDL
jgi:hypothetical protein